MRKSHFISHRLISYSAILFLIMFSYMPTSMAQQPLYINKIASLGNGGSGYEISILNNYAYVTGNEGFDVIDITNPFKSKIVGSFLIQNGAFGICIKNDLAFLAAGGSGLVIANISNPLNPSFVGECSIEGLSSGIYATDNYAYIANYENGLQIVDITNISNPVKVGEYSTYGRADHVIVIEEIAFVTHPSSGLVILNVTNPTSPSFIRIVPFTGGATDIFIHQDLLFVSRYTSGVSVLNISTPNNPSIIGTYHDDDGGEAQGVAGNSTHLYVADNFGVEYLDLTDLPIIEKRVENRKRISSAHDIGFKDNFLFIAGGGVGKICIAFEVSKTQKSTLLGIYIGIPVSVSVITALSLVYWFKIRKK